MPLLRLRLQVTRIVVACLPRCLDVFFSFKSENWRVREAAVLALGAAADGTINGMVSVGGNMRFTHHADRVGAKVPMLPQLTASLITMAGNSQVGVKSCALSNIKLNASPYLSMRSSVSW
jgi:hypothetical protein